MINTKEMIDNLILQAQKVEGFSPQKLNSMYKLGIILEKNIPSLTDNRPHKGKNYKYVAWKWYEYIAKKFDPDHWFEISDANELTGVKVTMTWFGKQYSAWYAIDEIAKAKATGELIDTKSEKYVNEGMRCYAKLFSRATHLFYHLWIEGENN